MTENCSSFNQSLLSCDWLKAGQLLVRYFLKFDFLFEFCFSKRWFQIAVFLWIPLIPKQFKYLFQVYDTDLMRSTHTNTAKSVFFSVTNARLTSICRSGVVTLSAPKLSTRSTGSWTFSPSWPMAPSPSSRIKKIKW